MQFMLPDDSQKACKVNMVLSSIFYLEEEQQEQTLKHGQQGYVLLVCKAIVQAW